ncbi:MAG TPA: pre-peptidase, partial [Cyanobacteria bacterium UBA12227]|nr:pre-peptidase [Cyanobacteria bacterium UBA12227]HAX87329.1 pre-peptidase [Cyanobacteria bacterium UBA11370]
VINRSTAGGSSNEFINHQLGTGTYYVRVFPYGSANTNYNLSLNATPLDYAGNSLSSARNIGTLSGSRSFSDWVGRADTNDYYRFYVGSQSNFSLNL